MLACNTIKDDAQSLLALLDALSHKLAPLLIDESLDPGSSSPIRVRPVERRCSSPSAKVQFGKAAELVEHRAIHVVVDLELDVRGHLEDVARGVNSLATPIMEYGNVPAPWAHSASCPHSSIWCSGESR